MRAAPRQRGERGERERAADRRRSVRRSAERAARRAALATAEVERAARIDLYGQRAALGLDLFTGTPAAPRCRVADLGDVAPWNTLMLARVVALDAAEEVEAGED